MDNEWDHKHKGSPNSTNGNIDAVSDHDGGGYGFDGTLHASKVRFLYLISAFGGFAWSFQRW
jgi:hypothetical protein